MKKSIHPQYQQTKVRCSCGHVFAVGSTVASMEVEICSQCHPFYTGTKKIVDTAGRVEKFQARLKKTQAMKQPKSKPNKPAKKKA